MGYGTNMNKNMDILRIIGVICLVAIAYSAWNASKTYELQVQTQWITGAGNGTGIGSDISFGYKLIGNGCQEQGFSEASCQALLSLVADKVFQKHYDKLEIKSPKERVKK